MDGLLGGGGGQRVCWPPSQIIGGGGGAGPPWPPSSYAYEMEAKNENGRVASPETVPINVKRSQPLKERILPSTTVKILNIGTCMSEQTV